MRPSTGVSESLISVLDFSRLVALCVNGNSFRVMSQFGSDLLYEVRKVSRLVLLTAS